MVNPLFPNLHFEVGTRLNKRDRVEEIAIASTRGSALIFTANIITAIISIIVLTLLARLLGPIFFGQLSIVIILPSIAILFQDWAFSHALTRYIAYFQARGEPLNARNVTVVGSIFKITLGIFTFLFAFYLVDYFMIIALGRPDLVFLSRIASFTILAQALFTLNQSVMMGYDNTGRYSLNLVQNSAFRKILPLILVISGLGLFGAVVGETLGALLAGLIAILMVISIIPRDVENKSEKIRLDYNDTFKMMLVYSIPLYASFLTAGIFPQILSILAALHLDPWTLGNYTAALRLSTLMGFVSTPILIVLFPAFSKINGEKEQLDLQSLYTKGIKYSATIVVPMTALLIAISQPLVLILYGPAYYESGIYLSLILIIYFYSAIGSLVVGTFLRGQGKTKSYIMIGIILLMTGIPLALYLTPIWSVFGLIAASLIANFFAIFIPVLWVGHRYQLRPNWMFSVKIFFCSALSIILGVIPYLFLVGFNFWFAFLAILITFTITFTISFRITKPLTAQDFANLEFLLSSLGKAAIPFLYLFKVFERVVGVRK